MNCPKCNSESICGHEIPGVWDGVVYWRCEDCGHRWHRFPKGDTRRMRFEKLCPDIANELERNPPKP